MKVYPTKESLYRIPDKALFEPCEKGTRWEEEGLYCWFEGCYQVPESLAGQTLHIYPHIDGYEGLLWVNGKPYGNFASKVIIINHGNHYCNMLTQNAVAGEKIDIALEYYSHHHVRGEDPFDNRSEVYEIQYNNVDICVKDELICNFYYDLHIVNQMMQYLEKEEGFRVTYLPVDKDGRIRLDALRKALCEETILVSIMYVNNEVGSVQPIEEAVNIVKEYNPKILFHVDAVQGFGKYRIFPKRIGVDLMSISGHKIHGPKGTGVLYVNEKVKIKPIVFGGEQQKNVRSGTENVPGIAGIGLAAKEIYSNLEDKVAVMRELKDYFIEGVSKIDNITIHGLRHTNAALLLYAGEDIENVSAHLGHASADITSRVYAHMYAEVKIRLAKTVSNALFQ